MTGCGRSLGYVPNDEDGLPDVCGEDGLCEDCAEKLQQRVEELEAKYKTAAEANIEFAKRGQAAERDLAQVLESHREEQEAALQAERRAERLKEYVTHRPDCSAFRSRKDIDGDGRVIYLDLPCSCGLDEVMRG